MPPLSDSARRRSIVPQQRERGVLVTDIRVIGENRNAQRLGLELMEVQAKTSSASTLLTFISRHRNSTE